MKITSFTQEKTVLEQVSAAAPVAAKPNPAKTPAAGQAKPAVKPVTKPTGGKPSPKMAAPQATLTPGNKYPIAGYDPDRNEFMHMDDRGNGVRTPAQHFDNPRANPGSTVKYVGPNVSAGGPGSGRHAGFASDLHYEAHKRLGSLASKLDKQGWPTHAQNFRDVQKHLATGGDFDQGHESVMQDASHALNYSENAGNADNKLADKIDELHEHISRSLNSSIAAGGPGSGRKPGFGEGRRPGSGRPFGVKPGIHKVLTDAGFKHKGAYSPLQQRTEGSTSNKYQHPETGHTITVHKGGLWKHADEKGVGTPMGQANGTGAAALREHLATHGYGKVEAGGPGSGPKPGTGKKDATTTKKPYVGKVKAPARVQKGYERIARGWM